MRGRFVNTESLSHFILMSWTGERFRYRSELQIGAFAMSTEIQPKTAACSQADHHTQSALAIAWAFPRDFPHWGEIFASILDRRLRERLPDYSLPDPLVGQEGEIRQRAALLLLERFFKGNLRLQAATESGDWNQLINQLERSINAALHYSIKQLRKTILREWRRFETLDESVEIKSLQNQHPAYRQLFELPHEARRSLLLVSLAGGVKTKSIPKESERLILKIMEEGLSQTEVAEREGISRQAIHQRIGRVATIIRQAVEGAEFPSD